MVEPKYYNGNGLSPLKAFEQGLISRDEYIGFCKGNIIKYTIRAGKKDDALMDIIKAMDYLVELHKALTKDKTTIANNDKVRLNDNYENGLNIAEKLLRYKDSIFKQDNSRDMRKI